MVYVEVLYSDLSRRRVPIDEIATLPKDNVLIITVLAPDPEVGGLRRVTFSHSLDHYALCIRKWNGVDWVLLCGWDDDDFIWRRTVNPWEQGGRLQTEPPLGCMHVVFNGLAVPSEVWKKALEIFYKEVI